MLVCYATSVHFSWQLQCIVCKLYAFLGFLQNMYSSQRHKEPMLKWYYDMYYKSRSKNLMTLLLRVASLELHELLFAQNCLLPEVPIWMVLLVFH